MPEGPEIRLAADSLSEVLARKTASDVWFAFDRLKRWESRLSGRRIRRVEPRGKAFLVRFEHGPAIYAHQQLFGTWHVVPTRHRAPKTDRTLRPDRAYGSGLDCFD